MTVDNVEAVRAAVVALNAGDFDAALAQVHPDAEWQPLRVFPDSGSFRGPEGVREFFQSWMDTFRGFRVHLKTCAPVDEDRVLAVLWVSGEGAESGARVESPEFFQLIEFRDGRMIRAQMFETESDALEAAGSPE
jgi:ketosteroid isomerase-like protein